jgi:hypothetical protein
MMKSAVNALYKLLWNLDHYCPHEMFPDRERFVIEVSTGPTTSDLVTLPRKPTAIHFRRIYFTVSDTDSHPMSLG